MNTNTSITTLQDSNSRKLPNSRLSIVFPINEHPVMQNNLGFTFESTKAVLDLTTFTDREEHNSRTAFGSKVSERNVAEGGRHR